MLPPSLYDSTYTDWISSPSIAFDAWVCRQELKKDSIAIYRWMWGKLCDWLDAHQLRLDALTASQLGQFIEERQKDAQERKKVLADDAAQLSLAEKKSHHGYRYLRLVERIYQVLNTLPGAPAEAANPASLAARQRLAPGRNAPMGFLRQDEVQRLIGLIENEQNKKEKKESLGRGVSPEQAKWRRYRDLALLGVFLGGGLKVHEAVSLTVSCIVGDGRIQLPYSPKTRGASRDGDEGAGTFGRIIRLEPFAQTALQRWMALNADARGNEPVFLSSRGGLGMDASNMFRRIRSLLTESGVAQDTGTRSCGQTLRNTYAASLLGKGLDDLAIAEAMGWMDLVTVDRLRAAYLMWEQQSEESAR